MPFDLHIAEDSQEGRELQRIAALRHATPEQVLTRIVNDGIRQAAKTPAEELEEVATEVQELRAGESTATQSLADFLGDFIGSVHSGGANNSDNTGEKFKDYLVQKHREQRL